MKQTLYNNLQTIRNLFKRVPLAGGGEGFTTVQDGQEKVYYNVTIDFVALENMGKRAAANKTGTCVDGPLTVSVASRYRL